MCTIVSNNHYENCSPNWSSNEQINVFAEIRAREHHIELMTIGGLNLIVQNLDS